MYCLLYWAATVQCWHLTNAHLQRCLDKICMFAETEFRKIIVGPYKETCCSIFVYSLMLHALIALLARFNALLAADKCRIHSVVLVSLANFVFPKVLAQMQTVHWNQSSHDAEFVFLALQWVACNSILKAGYVATWKYTTLYRKVWLFSKAFVNNKQIYKNT